MVRGKVKVDPRGSPRPFPPVSGSSRTGPTRGSDLPSPFTQGQGWRSGREWSEWGHHPKNSPKIDQHPSLLFLSHNPPTPGGWGNRGRGGGLEVEEVWGRGGHREHLSWSGRAEEKGRDRGPTFI